MDDTTSFTVCDVELVRWQYRIVPLASMIDPQQLPTVLGELGASGWELTHVFEQARGAFVLFKRPVPAGAPDPDSGWVVVDDARAAVPDASVMAGASRGASLPRPVHDNDWARDELTCPECGEPQPAGRAWCSHCGGVLSQR